MRQKRTRNSACLALLLAAATTAIAPFAHAAAKDTWQDEILLQLSELRKSQGELRKEVADLRTEVAGLRTAGQGVAKGEPKVTLDLSSPLHPSLGDAKADIAIVEFSDFQCPYCRKHELATLPGLREKYVDTGKARYFFVDFPLSFHSQARGAAAAAACAHRQGAFWKMHDRLFENQSELGEALYSKLADELGLDKAKFAACLADPKMKETIDDNLELGDRVGVQGTPAFFIGRLKDGVLIDARMVSGARPAKDFETVLDRYLSGS